MYDKRERPYEKRDCVRTNEKMKRVLKWVFDGRTTPERAGGTHVKVKGWNREV